MKAERVIVRVGFMSPAECVRRIQAATPAEAEAMLHTLEQEARAAALEEAAKLIEGDAKYDNWNVKARRIRALLEGK